MTHLTITDSPKMIRETLHVAQVAIGLSDKYPDRRDEHTQRLNRLIAACDELRPIGPDDMLPRSIRQADIRVGDLVQRWSERADGTVTMVRGRVVEVESDRVRISDMWSGKPRGATIEWTLVERDPDGELIKTLIDAAWDGVSTANPLSEDEVRHLVSLQLAAIRETHDIVPKGGGGA